jgi:phosphoribosylformylglycinamidine synthase PurS subunit
MKVTVTVRRLPNISDPQGTTVARALRDLGHEVAKVRVDKFITLEIEGDDPDAVRAQAEEMCEKLLANPVMEEYEISFQP